MGVATEGTEAVLKLASCWSAADPLLLIHCCRKIELSELAALDDGDGLGGLAGGGGAVALDGLDDLGALDDLAEDDVLHQQQQVRKPRGKSEARKRIRG